MFFKRILFLFIFILFSFKHLNAFDPELDEQSSIVPIQRQVSLEVAPRILDAKTYFALRHPRDFELFIRNQQVFGSLYHKKALNLCNSLEQGFILNEWLGEFLTPRERHKLTKMDGNSTEDVDDDYDIIAIGRNKVAIYMDASNPFIRVFNMDDGSSEDWLVPASISQEFVVKLSPSHNERFLILQTEKSTYLGDLDKKTFTPVNFSLYQQTSVEEEFPPHVRIYPLSVPTKAWRQNSDLLRYQPFLGAFVKIRRKKNPAGEYVSGEYSHSMGSQVFFVPLDERAQERTPLTYPMYFTQGFIGEDFNPLYLGRANGAFFRVDSESSFEDVSGDFSIKPFQSNRDPGLQYFLDDRVGDKKIPKLRVLEGWETGTQHHFLEEKEAQSLETDVEVFIPNPHEPRSLLAYAINKARLEWKVPQETQDRGASQTLVELLNWLQDQTGYDFYPSLVDSQNPEVLVFKACSSFLPDKLLIIKPFQACEHFLVNCDVISFYDRLFEHRMPRVESFSVEATDGTRLYGYVTHPFKRLSHNPGLLTIHGGPSCRVTWHERWRYDDLFYASRGYTVFTINYRGSEGYGKKFKNALYQGYGTTDLEDNMAALNYAVKMGWVNPNFVGVMGVSYGAYAAVRVSEKFPAIFKAVIAENGFYDVAELIKEDKDRGRDIDLGIGLDPWSMEDKRQLDTLSALREVFRIEAPCLVMHGNVDTVCDFKQSVTLVKEMKKKSKEVSLVQFEEGEHILTNLEGIRVKYLVAELFLSRTLKGHSALPTDELQNAPGVKIREGAEFLGLSS